MFTRLVVVCSFVACASGAAPSRAHADAIGPCPEGQHVVMNPSSPGSMHHGGFHCEPDPGRCSVAGAGMRGRGADAGLFALALALLGLVAQRAQRR